MRLIRKSEGKKGGSFRLIVIFKSEFRTFFAYGFPKSKLRNIEDDELRGFKKQAKENLIAPEEQINAWVKNQTLIEILEEDYNEIQKRSNGSDPRTSS